AWWETSQKFTAVRNTPGRPSPSAVLGAAIHPISVAVVRTASPMPMHHSAATRPVTYRGREDGGTAGPRRAGRSRAPDASPRSGRPGALPPPPGASAAARDPALASLTRSMLAPRPPPGGPMARRVAFVVTRAGRRGPVLGGTWERRRGAGRERRPGRRAARASFAIAGDQRFFMISRMMTAVSLGVLPTRTPTFSRASFFASAVPDEPDTMAPAWPMVLPSGAVNPA